MNIELSNGLFHFYQWDTGQQVKAPDGVETIHFRIDNDHAAPITVVNGWATVPDECFQSGDDLVYYAYDENHTTDSARVEVVNRPKPDGYAYTPTEVKTWESLDARIKALEKGGGVAGVSSVNGQTGAVTITAEGLGALTEDNLQSATNAALAQAKASGEFDGAGLDVTGATVGQTVKISAVDANGVPTAWVPVDMTAGKELSWIEVVDITTSEQTQILTISTDKDGHMISQYNALGMIAAILFPADASQTSSNGAPWIYPMPLSTGVSEYRYIANVSAWKTVNRTLTMAWAGLPRVGWIDQYNSQTTFSINSPDFLKGLTIYIKNSGDHIPTGTRVRVAVLSRGIEE